jgi:hypothetical protein
MSGNMSGNMVFIEQWLEKTLLTSFRYESFKFAEPNTAVKFDAASILEAANVLCEASLNSHHAGKRYFSSNFSAMQELQLDRQALTAAGADKVAQDQLYRSLYVHSNAMHELISDFQRIHPSFMFRLWETFLRIFQYYDPHCRDQFLRFLFDTQNHTLQQTIADLRRTNVELQDHNESLLQELTLCQIELSSLRHVTQMQQSTATATTTHLQERLHSAEQALADVQQTHAALERLYGETKKTLLFTTKDVVPPLIYKLQRVIEEHGRSSGVIAHFRDQHETHQGLTRKLETEASALKDELLNQKRLVVEGQAVREALLSRDRLLTDRMAASEQAQALLVTALQEKDSLFDEVLSVVDALVGVNTKETEALVGLCRTARQCTATVLSFLTPLSIHAQLTEMLSTVSSGKSTVDNSTLGNTNSNTNNGNTDDGDSLNDTVSIPNMMSYGDEVFRLCLQDSVLPSRYQLVDVETELDDLLKDAEKVQGVNNEDSLDKADKETGTMCTERVNAAQRQFVLLPIVTSQSSAKDIRQYLRSLRDKISLFGIEFANQIRLSDDQNLDGDTETPSVNSSNLNINSINDCDTVININKERVIDNMGKTMHVNGKNDDAIDYWDGIDNTKTNINENNDNNISNNNNNNNEVNSPFSPLKVLESSFASSPSPTIAVAPPPPLLVCSKRVLQGLLGDDSRAFGHYALRQAQLLHSLTQSLTTSLPALRTVQAELSAANRKLVATAVTDRILFTPLLAKLFAQCTETRHAQQSTAALIESLTRTVEDLDRKQQAAAVVQNKYSQLEPKFLELVQHFQERTAAKKAVDIELTIAQQELEELESVRSRLAISEERLEAMTEELNFAMNRLSELHAQRDSRPLIGHHPAQNRTRFR